MAASIEVSPPYSQVFVHDPAVYERPVLAGGEAIASDGGCVAIATYPEQDGLTRITLVTGQELDDEPLPRSEPEHGVLLETPSREIVVGNVSLEVYLRMPTGAAHTRIRVWTNHARSPSEIVIAVG